VTDTAAADGLGEKLIELVAEWANTLPPGTSLPDALEQVEPRHARQLVRGLMKLAFEVCSDSLLELTKRT
jgi:hypothetical protein